MPRYLIHSIDFQKFHENAVYNFARNTLVGENLVSGIQNASFLTQIKASIASHIKDNKYFEIDNRLCKAMTIEQLNQLKSWTTGGTDANVIGSLFSKLYCEQLSSEVQSSMPFRAQYENMLNVYRAAKQQALPKSLQMQLLANALNLGPKACVYDVELFKAWVEW